MARDGKVFRQKPAPNGPVWGEISWNDIRDGDLILFVGATVELWRIGHVKDGDFDYHPRTLYL